jgi:hypothetical protein
MKLSFKILSTALLASAFAFTACNKNTECKANIKCQDKNGAPVKGAEVLLYANIKPGVDGDIKAHGVTDDNGKVSFVFKLPAIFDVKAAVSTKTATGMIKLEEGKTSEETLTVQ